MLLVNTVDRSYSSTVNYMSGSYMKCNTGWNVSGAATGGVL